MSVLSCAFHLIRGTFEIVSASHTVVSFFMLFSGLQYQQYSPFCAPRQWFTDRRLLYAHSCDDLLKSPAEKGLGEGVKSDYSEEWKMTLDGYGKYYFTYNNSYRVDEIWMYALLKISTYLSNLKSFEVTVDRQKWAKIMLSVGPVFVKQ